MSAKMKSIFITGDVANDYFLVRGKRFYSDDRDNNHKGTHQVRHKGGAYLIFEFLNAISEAWKSSKKAEQIQPVFGFKNAVFNNLPDKNNGYVSVSPFGKDKSCVWRIDEFLGFGDNAEVTNLTKQQIKIPEKNDIVIIDDANMDFHAALNKPLWSSLIETRKKSKSSEPDSLMIYKKSGEFESSALFEALLIASSSKQINLLTVVSINDIRKLDVKISSGLSWEQSAIDLVYELKNNDVLGSLLKSKYLVITFQSSGALFVVNNGDNDFEYTLIFDADNMEDDDETKDQGQIIGRMSVFTAALASQIDLTKKDKHYKMADAIKSGLTAIRLFYKSGYIQFNGRLKYPFKAIAEELKKTKEFAYSSAPVPKPDLLPGGENNGWSILIDNYSDRKKKEGIEVKALSALAKNIVLKGPDILKNIPAGRFGNLLTIDRSEIESLRNLKKIMETYINCDDGKKPLSIAVFGPPGAGKSFAVEEIGTGIMGKKFNMLTFNLSQFNDSNDLIGALHQVRDWVLRKTIPIVFWDEFDSQSYKWLQYLLAPMQDGAFQEGQITHPVGKCIFIFAGGTSYNMSSFGRFINEDAGKDFILKKGPDFISRLNGYIDILGPNKRQLYNDSYKKAEDKWVDDPTDLTYPIRRAVFIIGLLRLKAPDFPFKLDWGLLNALIKVERYKHGSRSMSNLLNDIRRNNPRNLLLRSSLPSKSTMELYFKEADQFYNCMKVEIDFLEMVWEVAPLIHSYWCQTLNDPSNEYSVEYSLLPVFIKESNVQAARRIPEVLKAGGFRITQKNDSGKLDEAEYLASINKKPHPALEKMAIKEHDLWMEFYKENGWVYDKNRNDYAKKHNCLKPFEKLNKDDQDKDRKIISKYPEILEKAGFWVAKL